MYVSAIWYIILFATNLSEDNSPDFTLAINSGDEFKEYRIYESVDRLWTIDWPDKNDKSKIKTVPINFIIEQHTTLRTLLDGNHDPISIEKICDVETIDWDDATEIPMSKAVKKEGWSSIMITRNENGFSLKQEIGFFEAYQEIGVDWITKK